MDHNILKTRVEEACARVVDKGIDNCTDKEVTLACFGMLAFNGLQTLEETTTTMGNVAHEDSTRLQKLGNKIILACGGIELLTLLAVILVLLFK